MSYNPLESLGSRLAGRNWLGLAFFEEHRRYLSARYGSGMTRDILTVIKDADRDAAHRVAEALCPDATFTIAVQGGAIFVDYVNQDDESPENHNAGQSKFPSEIYTEASALLSAAIFLHGTLVAEAEFALCHPEYRTQIA